jgi:hypothetical protein
VAGEPWPALCGIGRRAAVRCRTISASRARPGCALRLGAAVPSHLRAEQACPRI